MNKQQLLDQAEESLKLMVLKNFTGSEKALMSAAVEKFFIERVGAFSRMEILEHFITPQDALGLFMTYLNDRITDQFGTVLCDPEGAAACIIGGVHASA
ncbi:MAG: hypothetical protein HKM93_13440 [Desulfobacteraceae bacterium]|nr:hypothetical protein [Desulfobacteraceae bacterium]